MAALHSYGRDLTVNYHVAYPYDPKGTFKIIQDVASQNIALCLFLAVIRKPGTEVIRNATYLFSTAIFISSILKCTPRARCIYVTYCYAHEMIRVMLKNV